MKLLKKNQFHKKKFEEKQFEATMVNLTNLLTEI